MLLALVRCKGPTKHIEIPLILNNMLLNVLRAHYNKTLGKPIVTGTRGWWRVQVIGRRLYLGCKCRPRLSRPSNNPPCCLLHGKKRMKYYSSYRPTLNHSTFCLIAEDLDDWTNGQCFGKNLTSHLIALTIFMHFLVVEMTSVHGAIW